MYMHLYVSIWFAQSWESIAKRSMYHAILHVFVTTDLLYMYMYKLDQSLIDTKYEILKQEFVH